MSIKTSSDKEVYHTPVLLDEVIGSLKLKENGLYFDGTLGGGGHSYEILKSGGRLIATDRDSDALNECVIRFKGLENRFTLIKDNFKNALPHLFSYAEKEGINIKNDGILDGVLLDLGISSHQIDTPERGMSYRFDTRLDMRMDLSQTIDAEMVVNTYSEDELKRILYEYGEEKFARRIVSAIIRERAKKPISTTGRLTEIIRASVPNSYHKNPSMRTFQALRIEVNNELNGLDKAIMDLFSVLKKGGRFCIITFHSLEDRIVKQEFSKLSQGCICDKSLPICVCNHKAEGKLLGKIKASENELKLNSRSASATLRVIEKL